MKEVSVINYIEVPEWMKVLGKRFPAPIKVSPAQYEIIGT